MRRGFFHVLREGMGQGENRGSRRGMKHPCRASSRLFTLLALRVSSLRRGYANLPCAVPILTGMTPEGNPLCVWPPSLWEESLNPCLARDRERGGSADGELSVPLPRRLYREAAIRYHHRRVYYSILSSQTVLTFHTVVLINTAQCARPRIPENRFCDDKKPVYDDSCLGLNDRPPRPPRPDVP